MLTQHRSRKAPKVESLGLTPMLTQHRSRSAESRKSRSDPDAHQKVESLGLTPMLRDPDAHAITPGSGGPSILTTGNLTLYSGTQFVVAIDGGTAGMGYSQTQVNGQAYLGGATLAPTGSGAGSGSGPIVLITSTGGVTGGFAGLPQGATVTYQGVTYQISYDYNPNGGTGNDVALIPMA